jgi:hypothetical protein
MTSGAKPRQPSPSLSSTKVFAAKQREWGEMPALLKTTQPIGLGSTNDSALGLDAISISRGFRLLVAGAEEFRLLAT